MKTVNIGVIAVQGDVTPHLNMLTQVGANAVPVRRSSELSSMDGVILPGGESTTMTKLYHYANLFEALQKFAQTGRAIWGTCAGCILLGNPSSDPRVQTLSLLDIQVNRNAYGRQTESFIADVKLSFDDVPLRGVFIRAPIIEKYSPDIEVVATWNHQPVHVEQHNRWASTFHPELTNDTRLHQRFVNVALATRSA